MTVVLLDQPSTDVVSPQPAESSTAPKMPSIASIRHIPMDHNYGQPPPMTPPDSNSPGPEDGDTGNEDEEDDGVTRCICEFDHDDGYMICCDKCSVWQHIECMGISSDAVPENYLCDQCQPRTLDRERARAIQQRKREDQSDDDDDDEDSEEERETPSYTAISNTPTRITLTAKVTQKRKRGPNKIKVKDQNIPPVQGESTDKEKKPKRRRRQKQKPPQGFVPVDEDTNEAWENSYSSYDHYEEVKENIYGKELEELPLNSGQENGYLPAVAGDDQLCKVVEVQRYKKGIVAIEDMDKNKFIIQCKGKLMLLSKFEAENPFFKRCSPYVFYYSKLDHLQLCVDARTHGNDARFVRRSCSPNSEVKHFFLNGRVCLGIFSSAPLPRGAEITIPFEFQFEEYHSNLDCACAQDSCAVMKYNLRFQNQIQDGHTQKRFKPHDEDSNSGSHQKMSPLKVSLANSHGMQGDSDSDIENNPEKRAKKSREDRKLEAYVRQIEKMEKKEKRKQQSQKEVKPELVSPVSQEVPFNKLCSKNMKGMKRSLNKKRAGTPGIKRKRARLSSCSSEPLSPDEHSSTASTPTTPKVSSVVSLPEVPESFCTYGTPSTSPNGSFRFPKDEKQSADEEIKEMLTKETVTTVTTEPADNSGPSSPSSPITPVDDSELNLKPAENVATSTTVQDPVPDERIDVATSATESLCTSTTESTQLSKEVNSNSVSECLVEINVSVGSGRNTPSPCPSTAGSPTSAESVMSGYSGCASERISPGPAPGSPVASVKFGPRATRTSPFYGSLKKRWLFQYLCNQDLTNEKPPNGLSLIVSNPLNGSVNGKTIPSSVRRNTMPKIVDPLPLKKRHLKKFQSTTFEPEKPVKETMRTLSNDSLCDEPLIVSSPVTLEQQVQIVLADSVNDLQPHKDNTLSNHEQFSSKEETLLRVGTSHVLSAGENLIANSSFSSHSAVDTLATSSSGILQRRPSDPRLVNNSPVSSTSPNPAGSPGGGIPVVSSAVSPGAVPVIGQSVVQCSQSIDSSGTPGKKKVSLLEYRNRSRNRLSVDLPRPVPPNPATVPTPASVPSSTFSSSVIKSSSLSASLPNLSVSSSSPSSLVHRSAVHSGEMNGPKLEPVSPDLEEKSSSDLLRQSSKLPNSAYGRVSYPKIEGKGLMFGDGDARLKREIQRKRELVTKKEEAERNLTSFISEQLLKDSKSRPPTVIGRSPGSSSNDSSNQSADLTGDAMDIEDDDSNSNSNIYVNTPVVPLSTLARPTQLPHRSSLLSQFNQPNYRIGHSHHPPVYISPAAPQLSSPSQPPPRLPSSSPQFLVTSPSGPAHVRYQSPYQAAAPSQTAGFFRH